MPRSFRSPESYHSEKITRDMLVSFLRERGFQKIRDQRKSFGKNTSQTLHATSPDGAIVSMRVKLCWRREKSRELHTYSAAQLLSKIGKKTWEQALESLAFRLQSEGCTHLLIVQRDHQRIIYAAAITLDSFTAIWLAQRDESARLIGEGLMGNRHKNHAENGRSPTIWLQDDAAPTVPEKLWQNAGVSDLAKLAAITALTIEHDDSVDDLPGLDPSLLGRDESERIQRMTSGVPRDPAVRREVLRRSGRRCERLGCGAERPYDGFLDVHHILGVETSDRVWNCIALCPNCHREAHTAPDRDEINRLLLEHIRTTASPAST